MPKFLINFDQYTKNRIQFLQSFSIIVESDTAANAKQLALDNISTVTTNDYARMNQRVGPISEQNIHIFRTPGAVNIITKVKRVRGA